MSFLDHAAFIAALSAEQRARIAVLREAVPLADTVGEALVYATYVTDGAIGAVSIWKLLEQADEEGGGGDDPEPEPEPDGDPPVTFVMLDWQADTTPSTPDAPTPTILLGQPREDTT